MVIMQSEAQQLFSRRFRLLCCSEHDEGSRQSIANRRKIGASGERAGERKKGTYSRIYSLTRPSLLHQLNPMRLSQLCTYRSTPSYQQLLELESEKGTERGLTSIQVDLAFCRLSTE